MTDYEIYKSIKMKSISDICDMLLIDSDNYDCYGKYQAKIDIPYKDNNSKLILVTSTNPTPYGEGKTTISIGICDVLNKNGYKSIGKDQVLLDYIIINKLLFKLKDLKINFVLIDNMDIIDEGCFDNDNGSMSSSVGEFKN